MINQEADELLKLFRVRLEGSTFTHQIDERIIKFLQLLKE